MSYYSLESGSVVNFLNKNVLQQIGFTGIPESNHNNNNNFINLIKLLIIKE